MEDNPQRQLLIVAMLFWMIPLISIFLAATISQLASSPMFFSKLAIIFAAIIGILLIRYSIKQRPLKLKDRILAGIAVVGITLYQFPIYSMAVFYSTQDPYVAFVAPLAAIVLLGVPILLLAILISSFGLHVKKYSLKQNIQSLLTLLLAAFFFIVPIFMSIGMFMMGPY
jgi:hypothetical protein